MRTLFITLFVLVSCVAGAQNAKPFKVSIAGGYAFPADKSTNDNVSKAGFAYSLEPQYELTKNLEVGVRFEQAFIKRPEILDDVVYFTSNAKSVLSAAVTANYVLRIGTSLRPYVGIGGGIYYADKSEQRQPSSSGSSIVYYPLPATTTFGGMGRIGVKYGLVHVEANYNLISDTSVTNAATRLTLTAKNSYFGFKAGITIGGSR